MKKQNPLRALGSWIDFFFCDEIIGGTIVFAALISYIVGSLSFFIMLLVSTFLIRCALVHYVDEYDRRLKMALHNAEEKVVKEEEDTTCYNKTTSD